MRWKEALRTNDARPKYQQLADFVRGAIERGDLSPRDRLPSVAGLARTLGVSKPTIVQAYRELEQEGRLVSQVGRGSYVATPREEVSKAPGAAASADASFDAGDSAARRAGLQRSRMAHRLAMERLLAEQVDPDVLDLRNVLPPVFPEARRAYASAMKRLARSDIDDVCSYPGNGDPGLREQIAERLSDGGDRIDARQVLITNGAQGALSLISLWAKQERMRFVCESPVCLSIRLSLHLFQNDVAEAPWGRTGLHLDALEEGAAPTILYCTPDAQNPTGLSLPEDDRAALGERASATGAIVVSDDIFRDLHFDGPPPTRLYHHLPEGQRIVIGSFSKSLAPGLRVGFLVAESDIAESIASLKRDLDLGQSLLAQRVVSHILADGYDSVLKAARRHYHANRDALVASLHDAMPDDVWFSTPVAGYYLWVELPEGCDAMRLYQLLLERRVAIRPGPTLDWEGRFDRHIRLSFAHAAPESLATVGPILRDAIEACRSATRESTWAASFADLV